MSKEIRKLIVDTSDIKEAREMYFKNAAQDSINKLSAELVRLARLPYRSWKNLDRIRSLDKQIEYLEETLAAYERDKKKQ